MKILFVCFISECLLSFSRCVGLDPSKTLHITIHQQMLQDYSRNINLVGPGSSLQPLGPTTQRESMEQLQTWKLILHTPC